MFCFEEDNQKNSAVVIINYGTGLTTKKHFFQYTSGCQVL
jgi:hypothetical protein